MKKMWVLLSVVILGYYYLPGTVLAATPAPSSNPTTSLRATATPRATTAPAPTASASPSAEVRRLLRQRLEQTLQDNNLASSNRILGLVGSISKVGTSTFSLTDVGGQEYTLQIASDTEIIQRKTKLALRDLALQSQVTVYALPLDNNILEARRVLVADSSLAETRKVWLGTIKELDKSKLTLAVRGNIPDQSWNLGTRVQYEDSVNTTITAKQVQADSAALVITDELEPGKTQVIRVHLLVPIRKDVL